MFKCTFVLNIGSTNKILIVFYFRYIDKNRVSVYEISKRM